MKTKIFSLLFAIVASIGITFASDTEVDGIWYDFNSDSQTATVTYRGNGSSEYPNRYSGAVTIPSSVTYNGKAYSVTSIGEEAFNGCTSLTSVTIPNSVTSIGFGAFGGCSNLTTINIPNSVTSIGYGAFYNCSSLPVINNIRYADTYLIEAVDKTLATYTIKDGTKWIGRDAFSNCSSLASIKIPNSVTSIGIFAFRGCSSLTYIETPAILFNEAYEIFYLYQEEMPSQYKQLIITAGTLTEEGFDRIRASYRNLESVDLTNTGNTELSDEAFKGCYNLQTLRLPAGLTKIGYMAVTECVKLKSISIPAGVTEIGDRAFENCRSMKTITFGGQASGVPGRLNAPMAQSQLKTIGNWAFYNCHELQNLVIPEGVEEIGDGAFYGCVYLEDLTLPASVRAIGDNCFALCAKLQKIIVNAPMPPTIQAKTFYDVQRQIPVYVPDDCVSAYKNDALWGEFNIQGAGNMLDALDNIESSAASVKTMRDGQLFILRGDKTYTVHGQKVK